MYSTFNVAIPIAPLLHLLTLLNTTHLLNEGLGTDLQIWLDLSPDINSFIKWQQAHSYS
jgi:hypothetical protein